MIVFKGGCAMNENESPRTHLILVVDDDEAIRTFLRAAFTRIGYTVIEAINGAEALEKARENPPDLVVSDVLMPIMDGYQLCMEWKKDNRLCAIPFVFYTGTFLDEEDSQLAQTLGAEDFITRPIEIKEFLRRVGEVLKKKEVSSPSHVDDDHFSKNHFQKYSASLVRKLEKKMEDLQAAKEKIEQEIRQQKQAQAKLRESEELFRAVFEQHAAVKLMIDPKTGNIIDANTAAEKFYGWSREKLCSMRIQEINTLPPEQVKEEMERARKAKKIHFNFRHRRADGSIRDVEVFSSAIQTKNRDFLHSIIHDVTEKKIIEEALRESEERYRTLVETQIEAICRWKLDTTLTFVNTAYCQMLGKNRDELVGQKWIQFVPEHAREEVLTPYKRAIREKHPVTYEHEVQTSKGLRWYRWHDVPLYNEHAEFFEFQSVGHDITDLVQADQELRNITANLQKLVEARTEELEKAHKALETFIYTVAHDLRAPVRHIGGFLQFLQNELGENISEKATHFLHTIGDAARHMSMLIDDLLEFARIGKINLKIESVDIQKLMEEVLNDFNDDIAQKHIAIECGTLHAIQVDRTLMRMVLVNLIGNAIKFTGPKEHPEIEISCKQSEHEHIISICDNGVGFDMKYADKLFGIFQRLHGDKEFAGTGIGLASVKQIISLHGGRVWAESKVGEGTCFYVALPQNPQTTKIVHRDVSPDHTREENNEQQKNDSSG